MKYILCLLTSLLLSAQTQIRPEQIKNWQQLNLHAIFNNSHYPYTQFNLNTITALQRSQINTNLAKLEIAGDFYTFFECDKYKDNVLIGCYYFTNTTTLPPLVIRIWAIPK